MPKRISLTKMVSVPANLKAEFAEMDGWEAESDAAMLLNGLGIDPDLTLCYR